VPFIKKHLRRRGAQGILGARRFGPSAQAGGSEQASPSAQGGRQALASPAAQSLADRLGLDLGKIRGSGKGGLITAQDVRASMAAAS